MKRIFATLLAFIFVPLFAERITVNPSNAVIVLPGKADGAVQFAAKELSRLIALKTGVAVPIVEKVPEGAYAFRMGRPAGVSLKPEEARWEVNSEGASIYGDATPVGPQINLPMILSVRVKSGDLYAVYDFAEKQMGFLFLAPGPLGTAFEPSEMLEFETGEGSWEPGQLVRRQLRTDINPREYKIFMGEQKHPWAPMLKVHPAFKVTEEEYAAKALETDLWLKQQRMGASIHLNYGHAFTDWWQKYSADHPEYFALYDGKREPARPDHVDYCKMCISNEGFQNQVIANWKQAGARKYINVCENDGAGFCECENCRAWDPPTEDGSPWKGPMTDRYVHFANVILAKARMINPEAQACFYAYSDYRLPPVKEKVDAGVVVGVVTSMLGGEEAKKTFDGWAAAGARQLFLRPNDQHVNTGLPMGFEKTLFEHFNMAYKKGIISTDYDALHGFWDVTGLADYVLARAHIYPDQSFEHWVDEYCSAYGPAAEAVKEYFAYYRENIWEKRILPNRKMIEERGRFGNFRRGLMWDLAKYYSVKDFDATDAILAKAANLPLSKNQRARLDELKLANQHARMTFLATTAKAGDTEAGRRILEFRIANRDKLNINWWQLTLIEQWYNDTTKIAAYLNSL